MHNNNDSSDDDLDTEVEMVSLLNSGEPSSFSKYRSESPSKEGQSAMQVRGVEDFKEYFWRNTVAR